MHFLSRRWNSTPVYCCSWPIKVISFDKVWAVVLLTALINLMSRFLSKVVNVQIRQSFFYFLLRIAFLNSFSKDRKETFSWLLGEGGVPLLALSGNKTRKRLVDFFAFKSVLCYVILYNMKHETNCLSRKQCHNCFYHVLVYFRNIYNSQTLFYPTYSICKIHQNKSVCCIIRLQHWIKRRRILCVFSLKNKYFKHLRSLFTCIMRPISITCEVFVGNANLLR